MAVSYRYVAEYSMTNGTGRGSTGPVHPKGEIAGQTMRSRTTGVAVKSASEPMSKEPSKDWSA
ncbi:hypothetical protein GCM10019016_067580 [Streptomyces prasinosporus]|uniref:Uncharacterized protein n=1 Tax=Streptomyces prasinosporus TaxID=68256 RepID=A0ABP6TYU6_9ACTN